MLTQLMSPLTGLSFYYRDLNRELKLTATRPAPLRGEVSSIRPLTERNATEGRSLQDARMRSST